MPDYSNPPHLVVGAGLAGCLLAWQLHRAGAPVHLLGSATLPSAHSVAAGVINPVTGRWMTKSWDFDALLPIAESTYLDLESALGIRIYQRIPEIRFCQNADDVKRLGRRLRNPRYANVLGRYLGPGCAAPQFQDEQGSFEIKSAAYVDLPELVRALRDFFARKGLYTDATFQHGTLRREAAHWSYQGITAESVIFCEGAAVRDNPWFDWVGLNPAKGETLLCRSPRLSLPQTLFHHKKWLLPYPDGSFRIGATYDEGDLSQEATEANRNKLLDETQAALRVPCPIEVIRHLAGIRPSTSDNRPMIGPHPGQPGLYLLNGLGSKGASTGPAMARQLARHLLAAAPIDAAVDLRRFL
jgi:glycine/D-amino acid oxidase-like deaminating enzyme